MIVYDKVKSTTKLPDVYYDDYHVYVVKQQKATGESFGINKFDGYEAQVTKYTKDEYIVATSKQLNGLSFKVDDGVLVVVTPD